MFGNSNSLGIVTQRKFKTVEAQAEVRYQWGVGQISSQTADMV